MSLRLLDPEQESYATPDLVPVMETLMSGLAAEAASFKRMFTCFMQEHPPAAESLPNTGYLCQVIQPTLDLWDAGDITSFCERIRDEGTSQYEPAVRNGLRAMSGLLRMVSFDLGQKSAAAALTASSHADVNETTWGLIGLADANFVFGDHGTAETLYHAILARFEDLEPRTLAEACRHHVYLLTFQREYKAARLSAATALRLLEPLPHDHTMGCVHLAFAHTFTANGWLQHAIRSFKHATTLLDPAIGFADCFQAVIHMALLPAEPEYHETALGYLVVLEDISTYPPGSLPDLLLQSSKISQLMYTQNHDRAQILAEQYGERFRNTVPHVWLTSALDLCAAYMHTGEKDKLRDVTGQIVAFALDTGEGTRHQHENTALVRFCLEYLDSSDYVANYSDLFDALRKSLGFQRWSITM